MKPICTCCASIEREVKNKVNTELVLRNLEMNQLNIDKLKSLFVDLNVLLFIYPTDFYGIPHCFDHKAAILRCEKSMAASL